MVPGDPFLQTSITDKKKICQGYMCDTITHVPLTNFFKYTVSVNVSFGLVPVLFSYLPRSREKNWSQFQLLLTNTCIIIRTCPVLIKINDILHVMSIA